MMAITRKVTAHDNMDAPWRTPPPSLVYGATMAYWLLPLPLLPGELLLPGLLGLLSLLEPPLLEPPGRWLGLLGLLPLDPLPLGLLGLLLGLLLEPLLPR